MDVLCQTGCSRLKAHFAVDWRANDFKTVNAQIVLRHCGKSGKARHHCTEREKIFDKSS